LTCGHPRPTHAAVRLLVLLLLTGCDATGWEDLPPQRTDTDESVQCVIAEQADLQLGHVPVDMLGGLMQVPIVLRNTCDHAVDGQLVAELVGGRRAATLVPSAMRLSAGDVQTVILMPAAEMTTGIHAFDVYFSGQSQPVLSVGIEVSGWRLLPVAQLVDLQVPADCGLSFDLAVGYLGRVPVELSALTLDAPAAWSVSADPVPTSLGLEDARRFQATVGLAPGSEEEVSGEVTLAAELAGPTRALELLQVNAAYEPDREPGVVFVWWVYEDGPQEIPLPIEIEEGSAYVVDDTDEEVGWDPERRVLEVDFYRQLGPNRLSIGAVPRCQPSR